jgi:predicted transcriptional regulator of viral defense system
VNARDAYARLRSLGVPVIRTSDAAAALELALPAAAQMLAALARSKLVSPIRKGLFWVDGSVALDPNRLPEFLTAPLPSYLSLQTALYRRGMIDQIPEVLYAATLARTQRVNLRVGSFSLHHLAPEVFGGFEELTNGVKLATSEKALFDFAYLSAGKSRLFVALPELELPRKFRHAELKRWIAKIPSERSRTITSRKLEEFLATASRP